MRKFFQRVNDKVNEFGIKVMHTVADKRGEGYVDSGVKILIAVVIGALLLGGLYTLFSGTIMPTVESKIKELFNYKG